MISVIIPVYNCSKYLKKTVSSVINQKFQDLEVIIINDGSTKKKVYSTIAKLRKRDSRIKSVNFSINKGVEKARLEGIKQANGNYIFFLDADDWLFNDSILGDLLKIALATDADYVETGVIKVLDRFGFISMKWNQYPSGLITREQLDKKYFNAFFGDNSLNLNCWGKLYKTDLLKKSSLKSYGYIYQEDVIFNLQLFQYLDKIYIFNSPGYCYRWGGMTKNYNPLYFKNLLSQFELKKKYLIHHKRENFLPNLYEWLIHITKDELILKIKKRNFSKNDSITFLKNIFKNPSFLNIEYYLPCEGKDIFQQAIIHKDYDKFYFECQKLATSKLFREKILTFIFRYIQKI